MSEAPNTEEVSEPVETGVEAETKAAPVEKVEEPATATDVAPANEANVPAPAAAIPEAETKAAPKRKQKAKPTKGVKLASGNLLVTH